jgi:hypothetical protein
MGVEGVGSRDHALVSWQSPISTLSHVRFSRLLRADHG